MSSVECKIGPDCNLEECGCDKCLKMFNAAKMFRKSLDKALSKCLEDTVSCYVDAAMIGKKEK